MLVPIEWIKEYVSFDVNMDDFCEEMIMSGSNIETMEEVGENLNGVVVGKIIAREKHPNADKLSICMVDVGQANPLQIVCGAGNAAVETLVPVALDGSIIPGKGEAKGIKITKGDLRGVESFGMICSAAELGFEDKVIPLQHKNGIWSLPEECQVGMPIVEALNLRDVVVDFEITPNRPDCLSMTGMAREVGAVYGRKIDLGTMEKKEEGSNRTEDLIQVEIREPELCYRYKAVVVEDVNVCQSPWWIQNRLMKAGMRPINNIVDITNYVMLEYGNPIHAFDIDNIESGKILVERARPKEKLITLDGKEREMDEEMLLIRDGEKGVAIAGIMGGLNSDIRQDTKNILIESAAFAKDSIRRTSKKLNLRTEASSRFEKGIDPDLAGIAADRVCQLIEMVGGGKVSMGDVDEYPRPRTKKIVEVRASRINRVLGIDLSIEEICNILGRLEMKTSTKGDIIEVLPHWTRMDVEIEEDIVEEVGRIYGYDRLPMTIPRGNSIANMGRRELMRRKARAAMTAFGGIEIQTYSFRSPSDADRIKLKSDAKERDYVRLLNPLGEENSIMRTNLLPGMMEILVSNYDKSVDSFCGYEIGNTFIKRDDEADGLPEEREVMVIGGYGQGLNFFKLKGIVEGLLKSLGIEGVYLEQETEEGGFHPGRCGKIKDRSNDEYLGIMGEVHPDVRFNFGMKARCYACIIDFYKLLAIEDRDIIYKPLPKYPSSGRDIAVVVKEEVPVGHMMDTIVASAGNLLDEVKLFDIYRGEQVGEGMKSVAFALSYRDLEKTLSEVEVAPIHENVVLSLKEKYDAVLRD